MRFRRPFVIASLVAIGVGAAVAACTLNPQPLPPMGDEATSLGDASADSSKFGTGPQNPAEDAGLSSDSDSAAPPGAGDSGDGGDAGDGGISDASDSG